MTTSRTGTASHKRWRREVLKRGQLDGITNCPACNIPLDYQRGTQPNSAEPDHILAWADGGRNTLDNAKILCRRCNQSRGNGRREGRQRKRQAASRRPVTTLVDW